MTKWLPLKVDPAAARSQLGELRDCLNTNARMSEGALRDFIAARPQIIASLGLLNAAADRIDRWAPEVTLVAKHECDFVVGDSHRCVYTLVELKDANPESIYRRVPATPYFTNRFNHGYSQIMDWLCVLDGLQDTPEFIDYWGQTTPPQFVGVLVIGRTPPLTLEGRRRMAWGSLKVKVNSHSILCLTYDDLTARLIDKTDIFASASGQPR
jgi:hypothetical protein